MHILTSRLRPVAALLGAIALVFVMISAISPAQAHSVLISTAPVADEQLASAPEEVVLTFNEDITDLGTEIAVTDPDGQSAADGSVVIEGPVVRQPLVDARPSGAYHVTWRAVSADGHPISGEFVFTAAASVGIEESTDAETGETTDATSVEVDTSEAAGPESTTTTDAPDTDATDADAPDTTDSGLSTTTWLIIGVVAAAAIALVVILSRGLMKNSSGDDR